MLCDYCGKNTTPIKWKYFGETRFYCSRGCQVKDLAVLYLVIGVVGVVIGFGLKSLIDLGGTGMAFYWSLLTLTLFIVGIISFFIGIIGVLMHLSSPPGKLSRSATELTCSACGKILPSSNENVIICDNCGSKNFRQVKN